MTVSNTITDMKLKRLIIACNETKNYRKVAVVGFTLMSNIIDEISLKLGMRPREKKKESLLTYIYMVNEVYEKNLQIQIFQEGIIQTVKEIELLFLRNKGDLPPEYVKKIIEVYYELRKVKVPNVYRSPTGDGYFDNTNLHMLSTGLRTSKKILVNSNQFYYKKLGSKNGPSKEN